MNEWLSKVMFTSVQTMTNEHIAKDEARPWEKIELLLDLHD